MAVKINTAAVLSAAEQIDTMNKQISNEILNVDSKIRTLCQNYEGEAARACVAKYEYIKRVFSDSRFSVVNGVVVFMKKLVVNDYENTEKNLTTAASAFK